MKKKRFKSKIVPKNAQLTKQCTTDKCRNYLFSDQHNFCDYCLVQYYCDGMLEKAGGSCDHYESGYTSEQVAVMLRRALNEPVMFLSRTHEYDVTGYRNEK